MENIMRKNNLFQWFISVTVLLLTVVGLYAEEAKIKPKELPAAVLTAFKQAYPDASIKGASKEEENGQTVYEIESKDGKHSRDLVYSAEGKILEVEEVINFDQLPAAVQQAIKAKYPDAKVEKAEKISKDAVVEFEVKLEQGEEDIIMILEPSGTIKSVAAKEEDEEKEGKDEDK
jgi:hypothetical protein